MPPEIRSDITFFNTAGGESCPRVTIISMEQLRALLARLAEEEPGMVQLESGEKDVLQVGIGGECACAHFTTHGAKPRYLCAKPRTVGASEDMGCCCGWTPASAPAELCLSFEEVVKIAEHFLMTGGCDPGFEWVEE